MKTRDILLFTLSLNLSGTISQGEQTPAFSSEQQRPVPRRSAEHRDSCAAGAACCPAALAQFCRVGCHGTPPRLIQSVAPTLRKVARPYPTGVVILELGINETGRVISACVLRSVRTDFDQAAQAAALQWRWHPFLLRGKPIGAVTTVTVCTPDTKGPGNSKRDRSECRLTE
jgi:TonB family protein